MNGHRALQDFEVPVLAHLLQELVSMHCLNGSDP